MGKSILIIFGILMVYGLAYVFEPEERTTIKLSDVKLGKDRESLEQYLYQGYWKKKFVWTPEWIRTWEEKKIYLPKWRRVWLPVKVKEWVKVQAGPPEWIKNVPGEFIVQMPQ